jgi:hypothetical protein
MAQSIGKDLNLADEAVQAIAIDIAEQIYQMPVIKDVVAVDEGGPKLVDRRNMTAAWELEQRVHVTNVAHLVAQHRHK